MTEIQRPPTTDRIALALEIVQMASRLGDYDSNVIGMAAEVIAEEQLQMRRAKRQSKGIDGHWLGVNGEESVQVKGISCSRILRHKGLVKFNLQTADEAENLVVILIYCRQAEYEIVYSGKTKAVGRLEMNAKRRGVRLIDLKTKHEIDMIVRKIALPVGD